MNSSTVFFVHLILYIILFCTSNGLKIQTTVEPSCHVVTDQGELDLSPIAKKDDAAFRYSDTADAEKLMWNPCYDVKPILEGCQSSGELFLTSQQGPNPVDPCSVLGTKSQSKFVVKNGKLALTYAGPQQLDFEVDFVCNSQDSTDFSCVQNDQGVICTATGKSVCLKNTAGPTTAKPPSGLSGGSVLIIIVVVLLVVYIVVGVLIMKFVKKAEGPELCPNLNFWKGLPFLVKDGVVFTVTCGKRRGYENM